MYDALIFDVDGTLWDSTDMVAKSWRATCAHLGISCPQIAPERLRQEFGKTLADIGLSLFSELSPEQAIAVTRQCCIDENAYLLAHRPPLYPGVKEVFQALSKKIPLFIVSNCQGGYIEVLLEVGHLAPYVTAHLCPGDTGEAKAANIIRIVNTYHLKNAAYVGDTFGDYTAVREAGIAFLFASYGFGEVPEPDAVIKKPLDLLNFF